MVTYENGVNRLRRQPQQKLLSSLCCGTSKKYARTQLQRPLQTIKRLKTPHKVTNGAGLNDAGR